MPYGGGPVSYGQPPSAGAAEGAGPHAVPYGDSVHHVAKEPPPLRAPPPVSVAPPPMAAVQAKPNGPTVNGSWPHVAGGYTNGPSAKLAPPPQQQQPSLAPAGVASSRVNQGYYQPGSSPLGTPTASGPLSYMHPTTSQSAPSLRGPPPSGLLPPTSHGSGTTLPARGASQPGLSPGPQAAGAPGHRPMLGPGGVPVGPPPPSSGGGPYSTPVMAPSGPPTSGQSGPPPPFSSNQHFAAGPPPQGQPSASAGFRPVMGPPPVSGPPHQHPYSGPGRLPVPPPVAQGPPSSQFSAPFAGGPVPGVPPSSVPQRQGFAPPTSAAGIAGAQQGGYPGPPPGGYPAGTNTGAPGQFSSYLHGRPSYPQQAGYSRSTSSVAMQQQAPQQPSLEPPIGGVPGYDAELHSRMAGMSVNASFNKLWGYEAYNLLQERNILPTAPEDPPKPALPGEGANCSPEIFRCTLTKIPETQSLLQKARLPLGVLIHPFRDVSHLPVIQNTTIVRCRSCRTYINPYVQFVERQKWKCNICFRINALPEDFMYDPADRKSVV